MNASSKRGPVLRTDGASFTLDGKPFDLWGIRTASATATTEQRDHLLDQLDAYRRHGVNTVAVYYMGCLGANYDPFTRDGTAIDAAHQERMETIIEACARRGMVVIVGIFYQNAPFGLRDADAVREAVSTVARKLEPYGNVIVNIANEHSSHNYDDVASIYDFQNPQRIIDLCQLVHEVDPDRIVGGGGYHRITNLPIGRADSVDTLLFDTGGRHRNSRVHADRYRDGGVRGKPLVNVETFGGWTGNFDRGIFPPHVRSRYRAEVDRAAIDEGLSVCFHNNPWCQSTDRPMRYDLGGMGTSDDPGIRWYFEAVRDARHRVGTL